MTHSNRVVYKTMKEIGLEKYFQGRLGPGKTPEEVSVFESFYKPNGTIKE
ncbi:MAG: hypothetical protein ABIG84_02135 [archaeon]